MVEALGAFALSVIVFAVGYGRLIEKIQRLEMLENDIKAINQINTILAVMQNDIHYIKEKIRILDEDQ
jgi:divalent metal cation (Fe/Co/Zn/Cd) transporter